MNGFLGVIILFAGDFVPRGWALCQGQTLTIDNSNRNLFQILGNAYGGNGINTFALPDLRGRAIAGVDDSKTPYHQRGMIGGNEVARLTPAMCPAHTHTLEVTITAHAASTTNSSSPENAVYATGENALYNYGTPNTFMAPYMAQVSTSATGNSEPVPVLQPVLALNYIICVNENI